MQRTRLNTLIDGTIFRMEQFFSNPWRRFSLLSLGLLLGFFTGQAVSTTGGQAAQWDVTMAALILLFTESISLWVYSRQRRTERLADNRRSPFFDTLNMFKMGIMYGLFLEAFKLGS